MLRAVNLLFLKEITTEKAKNVFNFFTLRPLLGSFE